MFPIALAAAMTENSRVNKCVQHMFREASVVFPMNNPVYEESKISDKSLYCGDARVSSDLHL